jgi:hypothetical protein
MPSAKSTAAITVTHKRNPSRLIALRPPFQSLYVGFSNAFAALEREQSCYIPL